MLAALYGGMELLALMFHPVVVSVPRLSLMFSTAATGAVSVLYLTACWVVSGSTVGAVAMGLRVVGVRRARLSPTVALLRAVTCVMFPVGLLWVVLDKHRRSFHDIIFRTKVVYAWR